MDEAEMRAKTERWREECIQEAKALWERLNAGGQGGKEMRAPRMAEFFGGSCRTLSAATYSPWGFKGLAVDRLPRGTGKDKAAEDCPDGLLWQTEFMDIKPAELPTLDWMHFSPDCTSCSGARTNTHHERRSEDNNWRGGGDDPKSNAFNHYFFNIMVIIADQRSRPGNKGVIFTIEQPAGGHYPLYDLERLKLPEKQGGIGAVELKINFCKFASALDPKPPHKPTYIWTNCHELIKECLKGKFRCKRACDEAPEAAPCKNDRDHGPGVEGSHGSARHAFPWGLANLLAQTCGSNCAMRRFEKEPKDDGKSRGEAMDDFVCKHCS